MEPKANAYFNRLEEPHTVALVSIAISLKRIADMMEVQGQVEIGLMSLNHAKLLWPRRET